MQASVIGWQLAYILSKNKEAHQKSSSHGSVDWREMHITVIHRVDFQFTQIEFCERMQFFEF